MRRQVMLHQQKYGGSLLSTVGDIGKNFGAFKVFKGTLACAIRDGIYCGCYIGLPTTIAELAQERYPTTCSDNSIGLRLLSSMTAGLMASVLTQPFDTIKTRMQVGSTSDELSEIHGID